MLLYTIARYLHFIAIFGVIATLIIKNTAIKTLVVTGIRSDKNIEIISGLNEGDRVVAEGLKKVRPGGKIKPIKE